MSSTTRKQDLLDGALRYGPQTPEFYASMLRKEERAKKGKWKVTSTTPVQMTLVLLLLLPPNLPREPGKLVQRPKLICF